MAQLKPLLILAHRMHYWALAAKLSQLKEKLKRKEQNVCVDCGVALSTRSRNRSIRCAMHQNMHRYYAKETQEIDL
jgi:hypothetical protein